MTQEHIFSGNDCTLSREHEIVLHVHRLGPLLLKEMPVIALTCFTDERRVCSFSSLSPACVPSRARHWWSLILRTDAWLAAGLGPRKVRPGQDFFATAVGRLAMRAMTSTSPELTGRRGLECDSELG
jgi:hypothetical protein